MTIYTFKANLETTLHIDDFGNAMEVVWDALGANTKISNVGFVTAGVSEAFVSFESELSFHEAENLVGEVLHSDKISVVKLSVFE